MSLAARARWAPTSPPRGAVRRRRARRVRARGLATGAPRTRALRLRRCAARGVDLLLFAGGDGTARDIHDAIGADLPLVGVPTGVKMHSGVFAATPDAAGSRRGRVPAPARRAAARADIADVDEEAAREDRVATRLYGEARVPRAPRYMLAAKAPSPAADAGLQALCEALRWLPGVTLLGPGTTTRAHLARGRCSASTRSRTASWSPPTSTSGSCSQLDADRLILGVVGGQGSLLGRGNQQLSPRVLRRIKELTIVAAADKLVQLDSPARRHRRRRARPSSCPATPAFTRHLGGRS